MMNDHRVEEKLMLHLQSHILGPKLKQALYN